MKANNLYLSQKQNFWGYIRFLGDRLGYSSKKAGIYTYSAEQIKECLAEYNLTIDSKTLVQIIDYINYRKEILTTFVKPHLMDLKEAEKRYYNLKKELKTQENIYLSPQPMNKQKGDKRKPAFFTCAINLLTENAINQFNSINNSTIKCDYDPHHLIYLTEDNNPKQIKATYSRRFDGAIPSLNSPTAIWEIKEYYYTTTFGSRIADGVYETQLDGYEIEKTKGFTPTHVFLIDGYSTWWGKGKSYLCRIIDALHMGLINEVIFGKEIYEVWPKKIQEICKAEYNKQKSKIRKADSQY